MLHVNFDVEDGHIVGLGFISPRVISPAEFDGNALVSSLNAHIDRTGFGLAVSHVSWEDPSGERPDIAHIAHVTLFEQAEMDSVSAELSYDRDMIKEDQVVKQIKKVVDDRLKKIESNKTKTDKEYVSDIKMKFFDKRDKHDYASVSILFVGDDRGQMYIKPTGAVTSDAKERTVNISEASKQVALLAKQVMNGRKEVAMEVEGKNASGRSEYFPVGGKYSTIP